MSGKNRFLVAEVSLHTIEKIWKLKKIFLTGDPGNLLGR